MPIIIAKKRKPIALTVISPIEVILIDVPPSILVVVIKALITAKIIRPITSSITAAPKITLDSTVSVSYTHLTLPTNREV